MHASNTCNRNRHAGHRASSLAQASVNTAGLERTQHTGTATQPHRNSSICLPAPKPTRQHSHQTTVLLCTALTTISSCLSQLKGAQNPSSKAVNTACTQAWYSPQAPPLRCIHTCLTLHTLHHLPSSLGTSPAHVFTALLLLVVLSLLLATSATRCSPLCFSSPRIGRHAAVVVGHGALKLLLLLVVVVP